MMFASTNGGGLCTTTGPTDVCKTPSPAGPVPIPYPNIAQCTQAVSSTLSKKVKILNKKTCILKTKIRMSSGDEPGTLGGVKSQKFKGPAKYKTGSSKVKAEGSKITYHTSLVIQNGVPNFNIIGLQSTPSQTKVTVMP